VGQNLVHKPLCLLWLADFRGVGFHGNTCPWGGLEEVETAWLGAGKPAAGWRCRLCTRPIRIWCAAKSTLGFRACVRSAWAR